MSDYRQPYAICHKDGGLTMICYSLDRVKDALVGSSCLNRSCFITTKLSGHNDWTRLDDDQTPLFPYESAGLAFFDAEAVHGVISAWMNEGIHSIFHQKAKAELRDRWPVLYQAIENLVRSTMTEGQEHGDDSRSGR